MSQDFFSGSISLELNDTTKADRVERFLENNPEILDVWQHGDGKFELVPSPDGGCYDGADFGEKLRSLFDTCHIVTGDIYDSSILWYKNDEYDGDTIDEVKVSADSEIEWFMYNWDLEGTDMLTLYDEKNQLNPFGTAQIYSFCSDPKDVLEFSPASQLNDFVVVSKEGLEAIVNANINVIAGLRVGAHTEEGQTPVEYFVDKFHLYKDLGEAYAEGFSMLEHDQF